MSNSICIRATNREFVLPPNASFQEIPTLPAELEQVQRDVGRVLSKLSQVDFVQSGALGDRDDRCDS